MEIGPSLGPFAERIPDVPERFDLVEVSIGEGDRALDAIEAGAVREDLAAADCTGVVHLPFRQPLATTVEHFDRANREYLAACLDVAAAMGARKAVAHLDGRGRGVDAAELTRERVRPQVEAVAAAGRERGVEVCFENVGNVGGLPLELVGEVVEAADVPLCFDVGHAFEEAGQDDTESFLRAHGDRVSHLHVHDVRHQGDSHIPIGSGQIDYGGVADALDEFDGTVTVEVFTDDFDYDELSAEKFLAAF
jgi:sugar phosphate isomerase/epimerase